MNCRTKSAAQYELPRFDNPGVGSGKIDKDSVYPTTTEKQQALIDGLNQDLAGEFQAIMM